jgi:hypothetical protein
MTQRILIVTAGMSLSAAITRTLLQEHGVVLLEHVEGSPHLEDVTPSLEDALARVKSHEPVKVFQERDYDYHDERRGDPQRDVAMLRREMLARERSQRHMLKKGRGRR